MSIANKILVAIGALLALALAGLALPLLKLADLRTEHERLLTRNLSLMVASNTLSRQAAVLAAQAPLLALAESDVARETARRRILDEAASTSVVQEQLIQGGLSAKALDNLMGAQELLLVAVDRLDFAVGQRLVLERRQAVLRRQVVATQRRLDAVAAEPGLAAVVAPLRQALALVDAAGLARLEYQLEGSAGRFAALLAAAEVADGAGELAAERATVAALGAPEEGMFQVCGRLLRVEQTVLGGLRLNRDLADRFRSHAANLAHDLSEEMRRQEARVAAALGDVQSMVALVGLVMLVAMVGFTLFLRRAVVRRLQAVHDQVADGGEALGPGDEIARIDAALRAYRGRIETREEDLRRARDVAERQAEELRSLTRRLQAALAEREEVLASQRQFLAMASHEFRTPLAIIDNTAQVLQLVAAEAGERVMGKLDKIQRAVRRMVMLMDACLAEERLETPEKAVKAGLLDLGQFVGTVCAEQMGFIPDHVFAVKLAPEPVPVWGDASLLTVVLANLIDNAIKYSPPGTPIEVSVTREGGDGVVIVADHGPGLAEAELGQIFRKFFRGQEGCGGRPGAGLGLYLVSRIAVLHGGQAAAANRPGGGAAFTLRLPLAGDNQPRLSAADCAKGSSPAPPERA